MYIRQYKFLSGRLFLLFFFLVFCEKNTYALYGYTKKAKDITIHNTTIIRTTEGKAGFRNDTGIKYGVNNYLDISAETSTIGGKNFFGINYQNFITSVQLYRSERIGFSFGCGLRSKHLSIINEEDSDWIISSAKNHTKPLFYLSFTYKVNKNNILDTRFMYRDHGTYQYFRLYIDYLIIINNLTIRTFIWNTLNSKDIRLSYALSDISFIYKVTKKLSIGIGFDYFFAYKIRYSIHNHSLVLKMSYNI